MRRTPQGQRKNPAGRLSRLLLVGCLLLCVGASATSRKLVILSSSSYLNPDLIREFEQVQRVSVQQTSFSSQEQLARWLLETNGQGFDLIIVAGRNIRSYVGRNWLRPLDIASVPNLVHTRDYWRDRFADAREFAVPLAWGTIGIAWRADLVTEPLISWQQLYRPAGQLSGRIGMMSSPEHLVGMALKSLGYSVNSDDLTQLDEARALIKSQVPHVRSWEYELPNSDSKLLSGMHYATVSYSGDALRLQHYNDQIRYTLPVEGGIIWADYLAVSGSSHQPEMAYRFIDFFSTPENAARQALFCRNATPNTGAENLLPEAFMNHPAIYPKSSGFAQSEYYLPGSPAALRHRNETLAEIRQ